MTIWKTLLGRLRGDSRPETLSVSVSDRVNVQAGLQLGAFGPSRNGGQKVGARRSDWFETKESTETDAATRFSRFIDNGLTDFHQPQQRDDVDVVGRSADGSKQEEFQVTRLWTGDFWKQLNTTDASDHELSKEEICDLIRERVERKGEKYARERRERLTLLIDTNPVPVLPTLIPDIRSNLKDVLDVIGFKSVSLVGSEKTYTFKVNPVVQNAEDDGAA